MATVSVSSTVHTGVEISVDDLQYEINEYDKFVFRFIQGNTQILGYTYRGSSSTAQAFTFSFWNDNYLGNNYFAPATSYTVTVDCYYNGAAYSVGPVPFTTDSIPPPSGSIAPIMFPTVKDQGVYGNCVAMSLSTAMEIFAVNTIGAGDFYENYSVSYIYGNDGGTSEMMLFDEAVSLCETYGSPRWELVTTSFPDSKSKAMSCTIFNEASPLAQTNARMQAFSGYKNIDFYDCAAVASAIRDNGYFMMNFRIPNNFNSIPSNGIVPQPSGGYTWTNHSIALIGLTTKDGKPHWIAQNSWGHIWGQSGLCYIPYDWGCGVQSPQDVHNAKETCGWTLDCYSVWNNLAPTAHPDAPTNIAGTQVQGTTDANISWAQPTYGASALIYARKHGTTDWWPKPAYGSVFDSTRGEIAFDKSTTAYEIMLIAVKDGALSQQSSIATISLTFISPWSWISSNGNASANMTSTAQTALLNKGPTTNFSYLVWNDLVNKINEAIAVSGRMWDNTSGYGTYNDTLMSKSGELMTAKRFNAARYNVGRLYQTGIEEVRTGDPMLGSYFIILAAKLNEWIATL